LQSARSKAQNAKNWETHHDGKRRGEHEWFKIQGSRFNRRQSRRRFKVQKFKEPGIFTAETLRARRSSKFAGSRRSRR